MFLFASSILSISSCRKDPPYRTTLQAEITTPLVEDYRNAVLGYYIGTVHNVHPYFLLDTTYIDTICITKWNNPDRISMRYQSYGYYEHVILQPGYTLENEPSQTDLEGAFTFNEHTTDLYFIRTGSFSATNYYSTFTGTKYLYRIR